MFVLGMVYLEREWSKARASGEGYQVNDQDIAMENLAPAPTIPLCRCSIPPRSSVSAIVGSLPHCGAVIAMLTIMGLKHKEAYKDIFVVTVAVPVIATLVAIGLVSVL